MQRATRVKNIARALELYLENARAYDKMMAKEREMFESGKRHLGNMMGWDTSQPIQQHDIDKAIEYLMPSGLTDKKARPVMKPPEEILPKFKKLFFDKEGRPIESLFYTIRPKFYKLLSEINEKTQQLVHQHDRERLKEIASGSVRRSSGMSTEDTYAQIFSGTEWISREELIKRTGERIEENMHASLIIALDYLASLPNAHLVRDFIMQQRQTLTSGTGTDSNRNLIFGPEIPKVQHDKETGKRFTEMFCITKKTRVTVRVEEPGTGKINVDGHGYDEIRYLQSRELMLAPMIITDKLGKIDVSGVVDEGPFGISIVPRAIRQGVAFGLAALFPHTLDALRISGLLTNDVRRKERNKINQRGARARWRWNKR